MDFLGSMSKLLDAKVYKDWRKDHADSFLAHGVYFEGPEAPWQIGFYNPKQDTLTVFEVGETIDCKPDEEVFHSDNEIEMLDAASIKLNLVQATEIAQQCLVKHKDIATKRIYVLQMFQGIPVYNITFLTQTYKTFNLKIDAGTGEVKEEHLHNLLDMIQQVKK